MKVFKSSKKLLLLLLILFLANCAEKIPTINSENPTKKISEIKLIDADFACYKINSVDDQLRSGAVFYPIKKSAAFKSNKGVEKCKQMDKAEKMPFSKRPAVLLVHGFSSDETTLHYQAKYLAKMGFVAMIFTTQVFAQPEQWTGAYEDMLLSFKRENSLEKSPVFEKMDAKNISLMGHSMGGGGLFFFADKFPDLKFSAVIALAPFNINLIESWYPGTKQSSPTLILSGNSDMVAAPNQQKLYYNRISKEIPKTIVELKGITHSDYNNSGSDADHEIIDKYIKDWLKIFAYKMDIKETSYAKSSLENLKKSGEIVYLKTNKLPAEIKR